MAKASKRQHYVARFYLRNFAEPMFSDNLCVYDLRKCRWERRSPDGVGWFPHLCSMFEMDGKRTDSFDQFLNKQVEVPATPALKILATEDSLDAAGRPAVALFIALTAARSPELINEVLTAHLGGLGPAESAELDAFVKLWCGWTGRPYDAKSHAEFLKPSSFGAIWYWCQNVQRRLLEWEWHLIRTTRDQPFVTSDRPIYMCRDEGVYFVSFPVSSEASLIIFAGGALNKSRDRTKEVWATNRQTISRAKEFVVCCRRDFPGDEFLPKSAAIISKEAVDMFTRITYDPAILSGKACIKGTRISVEMILEWVASGASRDDIVKSYPQLTAEDVEEALNFAAQSLSNETIMTAEIPS